ncbi:hypothetical protein [Lysinibacter sp. HNR]|uniref:hypothetical protein n=1 Tax=Lysinibacter sp. HNR TaxID=3031408 RepID=UPI0024359998|nr:hypothetical protein [Lysinibacter sp. HNR]WGD36830.1 hypothetical protein FrondiHNR_10265 [Lysinibacter sp. HNR]
MTTWYIFETLTGRILAEFEPVTGSWSARINEPETVDVTIDLSSPDEAGRDWRNLATPWKHALAMEESGRWFGGPIQPHDYEADEARLSVTARGIRSIFKKRYALPPAALTQPLVGSDGVPNAAMDTNLAGLDLGSIGMRIVQQACEWPASNFPIVFPPARKGTRVRNYTAVKFPNISDTLDSLSDVINGPDFSFGLRRKSSTHLEWVFESGTEENPRLISPEVFTWDISAEDSAGSAPTILTDPTNMASLSWATGGKGSNEDNSVLVSRQYDPALIDAGMPLLETLDTSRTSVSEQETLDGWAAEPLRTGKTPAQFWAFKASLLLPPFLSEYRIGDMCEIVLQDDLFIPDGIYRRRIVEMSGDEAGEWVTITCGEAYDG